MYLKLGKNCNEFTLMGWGGQISTTLDNVTERWNLCENLGFQIDYLRRCGDLDGYEDLSVIEKIEFER